MVEFISFFVVCAMLLGFAVVLMVAFAPDKSNKQDR